MGEKFFVVDTSSVFAAGEATFCGARGTLARTPLRGCPRGEGLKAVEHSSPLHLTVNEAATPSPSFALQVPPLP